MRPTVEAAARLWADATRGRPGVTVLGYHRVDHGGGGMKVSPETFARQMALLADLEVAGQPVPTLSLDDAVERIGNGTIEERAVVVTFDDAWVDNLTNAVEPMRAHGLSATVFAPSRLLGTRGHLTIAQLREIAEAGWGVGSHTRTHPDLRRCSDAELMSELRGSREDLEDILGRPVTTFAYPTGLFDDRVVSAVGRAGYLVGLTTRQGWLRRDTPALRVPRSFVEDVADETFAAIATGGLTFLRPLDVARERLATARELRMERASRR